MSPALVPSLGSRILLLHSPQTNPYPILQRLFNADSEPFGALVPWTISNKYYSADVWFWVVEQGKEDALDEGVEGVGAVVLLLEGDEETIPSLPALSTAEVLLAVSLFPSLPATLQDALFDTGFELVQVPRSATPSEADAEPGRATDGLPRVRDALQTVLWPDLTRHAPTRVARSDTPISRGASPDIDPAHRILLLHQSPLDPEPFLSHFSPSPSPSSSIRPWQISNKYYTASVHFLSVSLPSTPSPSTPTLNLDQYFAQALVVLFDPSTSPTPLLDALPPDFEPEVMLAVSLPPSFSSSSSSAPTPDALDDLLGSHGFEYVDLSRASGPPSDAEDDAGEGRATGGISRIKDALQTVLWPNMVRVSSTSTASSSISTFSLRTSSSSAPTTSDADEADLLESWLNSEDAFVPPRSTTTSTTSAHAFEDDFVPRANNGSTRSGDGVPSFGGAGADRAGDLSALFAQLSTMRDQVRGIEDFDERRRVAGRVALALAAGLGLGVDEDEAGLVEGEGDEDWGKFEGGGQ